MNKSLALRFVLWYILIVTSKPYFCTALVNQSYTIIEMFGKVLSNSFYLITKKVPDIR